MRQARTLVIIMAIQWLVSHGLADERGLPLYAAEIRSASNLLLSSSATEDEIQKALLGLVATLSKMAKEVPLADQVRSRLDTAYSRLQTGSGLGPEAVSALNEAYQALAEGKRFAFPGHVVNMSQALEYGRRLIQNSLEALQAGRSEQAVRGVLEFILLVITPVERPL